MKENEKTFTLLMMANRRMKQKVTDKRDKNFEKGIA